MIISERLAQEFELKQEYSDNIIKLIDEGCTIPFIARYRKEMHGTCDDQTLRKFADRLTYLRNLEKRKEEVKNSIESQGKWTDELAESVANAETMTEVEDIYRPYKKKKKTRASVAIEKGLSDLADIIMSDLKDGDIVEIATPFVNEEKGVNSIKEAIDGAKDIVAERISDDAEVRKELRELFVGIGDICTTLDEEKDAEKGSIFGMYKDYTEKIKAIPSHRILAINRGEKEDCLKVDLKLDKETALNTINTKYVHTDCLFTNVMLEATEDSYDRLILPSIEREIRNDLTDNANEGAIKMFETNLKPLLMQPPLKNKVVLALDPAYRTGCKVAVLDENGNVLATGVVYPTPPQSKVDEAEAKLTALIKAHSVEVISIGNGTASKETEIFVANLIKKLDRPLQYMVVSEAGASVYSASELGAEEFPDYDVSLRSAVSIGRRLQDPLAELIKIDVKSIGVGQYQHDMPQKRLTEVLEGVVEDCVNSVGVDLNTASYKLLSFVSGLNLAIAKNIVEYRKSKPFTKREQLLKVPKLGPKAYEQCAGFLRITDGVEALDNTSVHPESYEATRALLVIFGLTEKDVTSGNLGELEEKINSYGKAKLANELGIGMPTLEDIIEEIKKPGRDIRDSLPKPILRDDLMDINNLKEGMEIVGTVRNVIDFGAFVDIGVHQDGLVHISEISNDYIKHPSDALTVGDIVTVKVIGVDPAKNRISLTIKGASNAKPKSESTVKDPKLLDRKDKKNNKDFKAGNNKGNFKGNDKAGFKGNKPKKPEQNMDDLLLKLQNKFNRR